MGNYIGERVRRFAKNLQLNPYAARINEFSTDKNLTQNSEQKAPTENTIIGFVSNTFSTIQFDINTTISDIKTCLSEKISFKPILIKPNYTEFIIQTNDATLLLRVDGTYYDVSDKDLIYNNVTETTPNIIVTIANNNNFNNQEYTKNIEKIIINETVTSFVANNLNAFYNVRTDELFMGFLDVENKCITNISRGCFYNSSFEPYEISTLKNGDELEVLNLKRIYFNPVSYECQYSDVDPIWQPNKPENISKYWFKLDLINNKSSWCKYNSDLGYWDSIKSGFIGYIVFRNNSIIAAKTADIGSVIDEINTIELEKVDDDIIETKFTSNSITLFEGIKEKKFDGIRWSLSENLIDSTTLNAGTYYLYISGNFVPYVSKLQPKFLSEQGVYVYPYHYWRCVGRIKYTADGDIIELYDFTHRKYYNHIDVERFELNFVVDPNDSIITINGVQRKKARLLKNSMYSYMVSRDHYITEVGSGTIVKNTERVIKLILEKYTIKINATPTDATVIINDVIRKQLQLDYLTPYSYSISRTGYISQSKSGIIESDLDLDINLTAIIYNYTFNLTPRNTDITVTCTNPYNTITGQGSVSIDSIIDSKITLTATCYGYKNYSYVIDKVQDGSTSRVFDLNMQPLQYRLKFDVDTANANIALVYDGESHIYTQPIFLNFNTVVNYTVSKTGFDTETGSITITKDSVVSIYMTEQHPIITVNTVDPEDGATIIFNGTTEASSYTANQGEEYTVTIGKQGYITKTITAVATKSYTWNVYLEHAAGS